MLLNCTNFPSAPCLPVSLVSFGISRRCIYVAVAIHVRCLITNIVSTFKCVRLHQLIFCGIFSRVRFAISIVNGIRLFHAVELLFRCNENNRRIQKEHRTWWDDVFFFAFRRKKFAVFPCILFFFSFSTFWFVFKSDRPKHSIQHPSVRSSRFAK